MHAFNNTSIKNKLQLIILLTSTIVLLLSLTVFVVNDLITFRRNMVSDLFVFADLVGMNSMAGIMFDEPDTAEENIAALKANPHIILTHIFTNDGERFVSYFREQPDSAATYGTADSYYFKNKEVQGNKQIEDKHFFHDDYVEIFKRITFKKKRIIGIVYIQSDLHVFDNRLKLAGKIMTAVVMAALLLAFFLASRLQKMITAPIYTLLETMKKVSSASEENYSLRASKSVNDETGALVDGFNEMLGKIEKRDTELGNYRSHLEEMVGQRTAELTKRSDELARRGIELAEARDHAMAANHAKSAFLANMSHELRTPLNGILGYTQILGRDKSLEKQQQEGIAVIQRSGEYLLTLINDILDLSKVEAGKVELYPVDFDLGQFIQGTVEIFEIRARQKGIAFHYHALSHLPSGVRADDKRLRQILMNLLGNAVKFTVSGGVTLKIGYDNGKIRFQVEDTGIGIPKEDLEDIFLPFRQSGDILQKAEGTGLGLSITKTLVELMGGELHAESTQGKGSTFWAVLELPKIPDFKGADEMEKPLVTGYEILPASSDGKPYKILVVDDKEANRSVLLNLLVPLGFEVQEAQNGREGVEKARAWRPDIILMDLVMPVMDGFEATRTIKKIPELAASPEQGRRETVVIAVSASVFGEHQQESLNAGCKEFIVKPVHFEKLLACLEEHLPLTWTYAQAAPEKADASHEKDGERLQAAMPPVEPSREQAAALFDLAMDGYMAEINAYAEQLEQTDPRLHSFVEKVRELAKEFDDEAICELVEQYMEKKT
ncbi:MAG: response regulator [Gammaproteobacteria bacterium]|nr:response regulator [Gammaproteobacteria bacterium]